MPSLSVRCPRCQKVFKVDAALAGQATSCPHCQQGMVVPTPGPPPGASAPPVVHAPPVVNAPSALPTASTPVATKPIVAPEIHVKPAVASAPKPVETPAPKRMLTPQEKAKIAFRANLIMLAFGMVVLTVTMLVLLYLTDGGGP